MPKLTKNMYRSVKTGERRLNCYLIHIPKEVVSKAGIKEDDDVMVYAKNNKIVIEKNNEKKEI